MFFVLFHKKVTQKINSLKGLHEKLKMIKKYLDSIMEDKTSASREIIYNLQVLIIKY